MNRAVEFFGVTFDYKRAGFILPDGDLLNLPPYFHNKIGDVYYSVLVDWPSRLRGSGIMAFIADGAVRISAQDNYVWLEAANPLTREQIDSLQFIIDAASRTGAVIDVRVWRGDRYAVESKEWRYHIPSASAIAAFAEHVLRESDSSRVNPRLYWGRQGAGLLFVRDENIFLTFRSIAVNEPRTWGVPGGRVEPGEDPLAAAERETFEELGTLPAYQVVGEVAFDDEDFTYTTFIAKVNDPRWPVEVQLNWENEDAGWFDLKEARTLPLHFGLEYVLEKTYGLAA